MIALRPASVVMKLERLGASHQTRLSFMRVLLRKLKEGRWKADRPVWQIDRSGFGHAVYRIRGQGQTYSLVAFSHDLPAAKRSDRVIAEAWDATFALVDGEAGAEDIARLSHNVPLQEAGRVSDRELVLSRANRSMRAWDHVVAQLSAGHQPDRALLFEVGYLMRTTAVYGSGKFGSADFGILRERPVMGGPFRAEMLAVWLIRTFVVDLVEHVAQAKGGKAAAKLDPDLRRSLGIGNSTGLGMAPFLVNHPALLNAWIFARETALARVRSLKGATAASLQAFAHASKQAQRQIETWSSKHPYQSNKISDLKRDMIRLNAAVDEGALQGEMPWNRFYLWAEDNLSVEGQELLVSLLLETHGSIADPLADTMAADENRGFQINGQMQVKELIDDIQARYDWALGFANARSETARFWYTSAAKLEPRLGDRYAEHGAELELPLDIARAVSALFAALNDNDPTEGLSAFLQRHAEHRHTVRRVQQTAHLPYGEICDNLISDQIMPIDMLRSKLAFFGATKFDPRSDRWLRITMFQGAPFPGELDARDAEAWIYAGQAA